MQQPVPEDGITPERRLGQRFHVFHNLLAAAYARRTEREFRVALVEWRVLRAVIPTPDVVQGEVAMDEGLSVMSVSRAVAALRRKGLVDVRPDPGDRRRSLLRATPMGHEIGAEIADRERVMYAHVFSDLSNEELAQFDDLMGRVNRTLRDAVAPPPPEASRPWADILADEDRGPEAAAC